MYVYLNVYVPIELLLIQYVPTNRHTDFFLVQVINTYTSFYHTTSKHKVQVWKIMRMISQYPWNLRPHNKKSVVVKIFSKKNRTMIIKLSKEEDGDMKN